MKKGKLFLLLSLLGLVVPAVAATSISSAYAEDDTADTANTDTGYNTDTGTDTGGYVDPDEPEDGHYKIEYDEEAEYYDITRYYKGYHIGHIEENFRAPSGCVLSIDADWNYLLDCRFELQEHEYFADKYDFDMVQVSAYRHINGSKMYSDSTDAWNVRVEDLETYVTDSISSLILYEINDKIADVDISATIEITLYTSIPDYEWSVGMTLVFEVEPYRVKKYVPGDILSLEVGYYYGERVSITAQLDENLFNEKYGFKTDGREPYPWDENQYWEDYLVQYFDKDTNIILDTDDAHDTIPGIELESIPTKPLTIFALLTFKAGGVEYKFFSNEVVVKDPVKGILIDGYNNRESIGANTQHKLTFDADVNNEEIVSAWLYVHLQGTSYDPCNHVCEPEEYWHYYNPAMKAYTSVTDEFWTFDFKYEIAGEYDLLIEFRYETSKEVYTSSLELPLVITEKQIEYTPIDKALTFNVDEERIDCVAGGNPIDLEAFISQDALNEGEVPAFEWNVNRLNVVDIKCDDNKATINPVGGGVVTISATCYGSAFGSVTKSIVFNVISDVYSITTLNIPDEFHYSGQDLTIGLSIDKYDSLRNFEPEWLVTNSKGEEVEFVNNKNCSITLEKPIQDDYTITALYNGVEIDSKVVQVRNVNVDKFIQKNIIWIALITLAFMGVVIFLKVILEKKGSLVSKIEKTNKKFDSIDRNSSLVVKQLGKVRLSIIADIDYARSLNMNALNEYEKTIRYLGKSLADIKDITKNRANMSDQEYSDAYNKLAKDLSKALVVAKEIEDAKELAMKNSFIANENNIAKVQTEKKSKKKKGK